MTGISGIFFIITALVAILSSLLMVTRKNPIHSALWMIVTFFALAVIYLLLNAQFIAVAQVMVYAGAIMMLIIFVIMLVQMDNAGNEASPDRRFSKFKLTGTIITLFLLIELVFGAIFYQVTGRQGEYSVEMVNNIGNVKAVGSLLYGKFLFPFEIASILLLVGIVGAVVLAKRK